MALLFGRRGLCIRNRSRRRELYVIVVYAAGLHGLAAFSPPYYRLFHRSASEFFFCHCERSEANLMIIEMALLRDKALAMTAVNPKIDIAISRINNVFYSAGNLT